MSRNLLFYLLFATLASSIAACNCNQQATGSPSESDPSSGDSDSSPGDSHGSVVDDDTGDEDIPLPTGVVEVSIETENFAHIDYVSVEYAVTEEAEDYYSNPIDDRQPTFHVLRPADVSPDDRLPLLVFHHGGAVGDDSGKEIPYACELTSIMTFSASQLQGAAAVSNTAAWRGWAMLVPRNDWCDAWQGLGPDDPVDPENHYGFYHVARAIDFMRAGGAGFEVYDKQMYTWGTSGGGTAAVSTSARYGGFAGVVFDSGISSFITYYELVGVDKGSTHAEMEHIFGGPPYDEKGEPNGEIWQRYQDASPEYLIREGHVDGPLFIAWNSQDVNLDPRHGEEMLAAAVQGMDESLWVEHDFDHPFPGTTNHVQTNALNAPLGYFAYAIEEFIGGNRLKIFEAEDGCGSAVCIGTVRTGSGGPDDDYVIYSKETVREAADGVSGLLYAGPLPSFVEDEQTLKAAVGIHAPEIEGMDPTAVVGQIVYTEGGKSVAELDITVEMLAEPGSIDIMELVGQAAGTWLSFVVTDAESGELRFENAGITVVRLDTVFFVVDNSL